MATATTPKTTTAGRPKTDDAKEKEIKAALTGLSFAEAEPIKRSRDKEPNPFADALGQSYEFDKALSTQVKADVVKRAENLLRRAADDLKIGVSIQSGEPDSDGMVTIVFQGKERRARKTKAEMAATDAPAVEGGDDTAAADGESPLPVESAGAEPVSVPA